MAYSEFTLRDIERDFQVSIREASDLFAAVPEATPSALLQSLLQVYTPLALAINTEKARSELLIAPVLVEVREQMQHCISLFSGVDFTVEPLKGLAGVCDFILAKSPQQQFIHSPVVAVVEAKNENLKSGFGQCIAAMIGAHLFNEREGNGVPTVFGVVTSGTLWRFLQLEQAVVTLDQQEYHLRQTGKVLGILLHLVRS
jgi:hypothetical protein